jgi:adenylate kinase family enzyme
MVRDFKFRHFSTGDLLRAEVKKQSELGKEIDSYISKGNLVPGKVTVELIKKCIMELDTNTTVILDGYPRNQDNIDCWQEVVADDITVVGCLFLECSEETMKDRIMKRGETSGRSDDNEEVFANRIKVYQEKSVPCSKFFEDKDMLYKVSAEGSKEECFEEVKLAIKKLGLDKEHKMNEMKLYLKNNVDRFVKPLVVHLMKNKPTNVLDSIKNWCDDQGTKIQQEIEAEQKEDDQQT